MKLHLAQINNRVGDLAFNKKLILEEVSEAESKDCDLAIFPEMAICGYPCFDLWLQNSFLEECYKTAMEIANSTKAFKCAILIGLPFMELDKRGGEAIYNAALLIQGGEIVEVIKKKSIPNYGVFDEARYFKASDLLFIIKFCGYKIAILICEDLWDAKVLYLLGEKEFDFAIAINSSPYHAGKLDIRYETARKFTTTLVKPLIYVNQVGGQDELVFDGGSFVMDSSGDLVLLLERFSSDSANFSLEEDGGDDESSHEAIAKKPYNFSPDEEKYSACVLGLRDYLAKSNFSKVIIGISGGIDSALVAAMAVDSIGAKNVTTYALPSRFNKESSMLDAKKCAKNLGVGFEIISIEPAFSAMLSSIPNLSDLAIENMQARIRGNILMSISNSGEGLLLSCSNKSETACGYATLYGDMCGAFSPIKDLYKTEIYQLAKWRNLNIPKIAIGDISKISQNPIPSDILTKAPSAELRENQKDSDSLPEYEILDKILYKLVEEAKMPEEIFGEFDSDLVLRIYKLLKNSEYKRKQSAIGTKISKMSFDRERRFPIVNKISD